MAEVEVGGTQQNITGVQEPRYGINIAGSQVSDRLTQEAFQNQERINQELNSRVNNLSVKLEENTRMLTSLAEAIQKLLV